MELVVEQASNGAVPRSPIDAADEDWDWRRHGATAFRPGAPLISDARPAGERFVNG